MMRFEIYIKQYDKPARYYTHAVEEYKKRLSGDCRLQYHFIRKDRDWDKILSDCLDERNRVYLLVPGNADVTSEEFSGWIGRWERSGAKRVVFLIDEKSEGSKSVLESQSNKISLSCFTMPAGMTAMILAEQIYRGYRIRNNQPYHK